MRRCLEWAEEYWEAVSVMGSVVCALAIAIVLAVAFNVISTRLDSLDHPAATTLDQRTDVPRIVVSWAIGD